MTANLPLLPFHRPDDRLAWHNGAWLTASQFLADVAAAAARLPPGHSVLNLCENRYHFLVALAAALLCEQVTLLPQNRAPRVLQQLREQYGDMQCLIDNADVPAGWPAVTVHAGSPAPSIIDAMPAVPVDRKAVVAFTSGTTGRPQPHAKSWGSLVYVAQASARRFALKPEDRFAVVATVPPQHVFGFETSIMLPTQNGGSLHGGRPFFPEDVRAALEACDSAPVLVTSPVHLRACVEAGLGFRSTRFVLSATAPLSAHLAQRAEALFGAPALEIYGCTEAGTVGTRRTIAQERWKLLDGVQLEVTGDNAVVLGDHLAMPILLNDFIEPQEQGYFLLKGRKADLVNIAGKRMSLADLTHKLLEIDGVEDGVFIVPDTTAGEAVRLVAFVVAPRLTAERLLAELRQRVDPAFLPRPLYLVQQLPRNATGKLTRDQLSQLTALCGAGAA